MSKLNERQQKFAEIFAENGGNASAAASDAGYKHPHSVCTRLLDNVGIQKLIAELTEKIKSARIASATERQEFWTSVMRGTSETMTSDDGELVNATKMTDRIKASELLGRSQLDFVEQVEIKGDLSLKSMSTEELIARTEELRAKRLNSAG